MPAENAGPEPTPDGRWIVVDGRRWRATDPSIPDALRAELVAELMDARRAVAAGGRAADDEAVRAARARVHAAKVALGERGHPWWEEPPGEALDARITATISALGSHRGERTFCPSDVARVAGGTSWRRLMDPVREVMRRLVAADELEVLQRGQPLGPDDEWRGPIRARTTQA